ncbi:hypothetical protein [Falsiroseomonas oryziterrae]|nr:hypothetical protein [Roseomonas sp. NPKOSM-4]
MPPCPRPAPQRSRVGAAIDLLHKLVTGCAALATLVKLLLG